MENLGFKKISLDTWLQPDNLNSHFVRYSEDFQEKHVITDIERLKDILVPQLNECVPLEIHKLFEVARGAIAYGYYFYPLYTLGREQLYRVADAALIHKYIRVSGRKSRASFSNRILYFKNENLFTQEEVNNWFDIKEFRNIASHPEDQSILYPNDALEALCKVSAAINCLYKEEK